MTFRARPSFKKFVENVAYMHACMQLDERDSRSVIQIDGEYPLHTGHW